jgi:hypothetical protein
MLKRRTDADPKLGEVLLVKLIAGNLRPFSIVEDSYFRDFIAHMCNNNGEYGKSQAYKVMFYDMQ